MDPLLRPYMTAPTEAATDRELDRLVRFAEPVIRGIVSRRWRIPLFRVSRRQQSVDESDAEDVYGDALAQLIGRLREGRAHPESEPIADFRAYVAVTTYRACDLRLREKYAERWKLKNRIRYLLTHSDGLALWMAEGRSVCGFSAWQAEHAPPGRAGRMKEVQDGPEGFTKQHFGGEDPQRANPADVLAALLRFAGGPVELDDVVGAMARLLDVTEPVAYEPPSGEEYAASPYENAPDPRANIEVQVSQRMYLERLWAEILELPERQRAALLLNLRDDQGKGVIALFVLRGIVSLEQIAAALALPWDRFARLWNDLPLEDLVIAELLGITRMQVIGLRKCARERLARRMRAAQL